MDFDADIYCFQEVRASEQTAKELIEGKTAQISLFDSLDNGSKISKKYNAVYNCGKVAGYAGTMILSKIKPSSIIYGIEEYFEDNEGRTVTIIFDNYAVVNTYIPNGNLRLDFKMQYIKGLNKYLNTLKEKYSVIFVGDFNICHNEIDLTNPKECSTKSVFLPIERKALNDILSLGFIDSFRYLNPSKVEYSWRSYRSRQYDSGPSGWKYRIDYICASNDLKNNLQDCKIFELPYSDHLPVVLDTLK